MHFQGLLLLFDRSHASLLRLVLQLSLSVLTPQPSSSIVSTVDENEHSLSEAVGELTGDALSMSMST